MRIFVDVVDAVRIEGTGAADNSVNFVAFAQQQFRQIGAILASNPCVLCAR